MSSNGSNPSHKDLLIQAKQRQKNDLIEASRNSEQVARALHAIVKVNSDNKSSKCPPVLDKITTIHDLDREIDRQLKQDVASNYEKFLNNKERLGHHIKRIDRAIAMERDSHETYIDLLQRKAEFVDQDLRILERTLKIIRDNE